MRRLIALALLVSLPATAGLYKWTDEHGKVHYSDVPPPRQQTAPVRIVNPDGVAPPTAPAADDSRHRRPAEEDTGPDSAACKNLSQYASLREARAKGCKLEQTGCVAHREYLQETEQAMARRAANQTQTTTGRVIGNAMELQLRERMRARGC